MNLKSVWVKVGLVFTVLLALYTVLGIVSSMVPAKAPEVTVTSPAPNAEVHGGSVTISGTVSEDDSDLTINSLRVQIRDGKFSQPLKLDPGTNNFNITATYRNKTANQTLVVNRVFTPEEQAQYDLVKQQAADAVAAEKAKAQAVLDAYYATKPGKVCKAHPEWSKSDCETIAAGKVHVGMSTVQAKASWGTPDDINRTTNALGTSEQWVYGYSSYLYFDDGVLTSISN